MIKILEHQKILKLLNEANGSKFVTRKLNIANGNWESNFDASDAYILVTGLSSLLS